MDWGNATDFVALINKSGMIRKPPKKRRMMVKSNVYKKSQRLSQASVKMAHEIIERNLNREIKIGDISDNKPSRHEPFPANLSTQIYHSTLKPRKMHGLKRTCTSSTFTSMGSHGIRQIVIDDTLTFRARGL